MFTLLAERAAMEGPLPGDRLPAPKVCKRGELVPQGLDGLPAMDRLLDEAKVNEEEARRAAQQLRRARDKAAQALWERLEAERKAKEQEEAAEHARRQEKVLWAEAERLRLEAERSSREAESAMQLRKKAGCQVQSCREIEEKLNTEVQKLQVTAEAAASKAKTTVETAALAATGEILGGPAQLGGLAAQLPVAAHPGELQFEYPSKSEAANATSIPARPGKEKANAMRLTWGTNHGDLQTTAPAYRPAASRWIEHKTEVIESVDERLVVAVLQGLLRVSDRPITRDARAQRRLPNGLLQKAAESLQSRDVDTFRDALRQVCGHPAVKGDVLVGAEVLRSSLARSLGAIVEADRAGAETFIQEAFPQDVLIEGEQLIERLEQLGSEQAILEYRQQARQQAPRPPPSLCSRRTMEMHRQFDPTVFSVVQMPTDEEGWEGNVRETLFLNNCDILCGARQAVDDHLGPLSARASA